MNNDATIKVYPEKMRVEWIDVAKGISILLVVLWHMFNFPIILTPLRMPLFFFVAGLFVKRSLELPWKEFLNKKVFRLFYLYVLWAFLLVSFYHVTIEKPDSLYTRITDYIVPVRTIWFLYSLALVLLVARALRRIPPMWTISGSCLLFVLLSHAPFIREWGIFKFLPVSQMLRTMPFFFLGMHALPWLRSKLPRYSPLFLWGGGAIFFILVIPYYAWYARSGGPPPFVPGLPFLLLAGLSVPCCLGLSYKLPSSSIVTRFLTYVGRNSLYIYLLHRFIIILAGWALLLCLKAVGWQEYRMWFEIFVVLPLACYLPFVAKRMAERFNLRFLFEKPEWLRIR